MSYRNLTEKQFRLVKYASLQICKDRDMENISDWKRMDDTIIDMLEKKELTYDDLLQDRIPYDLTNKITGAMK